MKKRKIDFILKERNGWRLIFRFYPRKSSCHSFDENPPKSWDEVYKVYYNYSILEEYDWDKYYNRDTDKPTEWDVYMVFDGSFDECSRIDEVGYVCLELAKGKTEITREIDGEHYTWQLLDRDMYPLGDGVSWRIHKYPGNENEEDLEEYEKQSTVYEFELFDYRNIGYRFTLETEKMKEFGQYLLDCCEYMLAHGESI